MEDNHTLLMMVLKQHFRDRANVVDDALQVIRDYCNQCSNKTEYEKTLNILYEMMNNDLPSNILLYFLSTVPLPKQNNCKSTVLELMKQTQNSLPENMRPILLEYLNSKLPPLVPLSKLTNDEIGADSEPKVIQEKVCPNNLVLEPCKKLVDTCAHYIVKNQYFLIMLYKSKREEAWRLLNEHFFHGETLLQCYAVIKDINKKMNWMRIVESGDVPTDTIKDEYGDSDVFVKERHIHELIMEDPFTLPGDLKECIHKLASA